MDLVTFDQPATVRLHWTNKPYVWHVNDGEEVFAVLDGEVDMHYRDDGVEKAQFMRAGDICRPDWATSTSPIRAAKHGSSWWSEWKHLTAQNPDRWRPPP